MTEALTFGDVIRRDDAICMVLADLWLGLSTVLGDGVYVLCLASEPEAFTTPGELYVFYADRCELVEEA